ncbi:MAG: ComF family protein [Candidatus Liberibacter europaeus]|uniref:ComF family protein n=1 Tax=Candidatus Liberibacter europaeus TaxID=744859 RepID=A0A2T4VYI4_9HYPH|nr:ComF family protein [Candidatus Liberibacter europaeus]PTL86842.1 MAG: ComF family protein [Candidatus Liberibacter europaeus]
MVDRYFCLCADCWSKIYFIPPPVQYLASNEEIANINEDNLFGSDSNLTQIRSVAVYCGMSCVLVRLLKYHDRIDLAIMMSKWMFRIGNDLVTDSDVIIAIPLHRFRLMRRQYNQSAELARLIAYYGDKTFLSGILIRSRNTKPQVDLSLSARKKNLYNAFSVPEDFVKYISGLKVLLVDDVYTTGATTRAATIALKKAGAISVRILTFARSLDYKH